MLLFVDDTQLLRKSEKIPCATKAYDRCKNKFQNAQVVLTIGAIWESEFLPLEVQEEAIFAVTQRQTLMGKYRNTLKNCPSRNSGILKSIFEMEMAT